MNKRIFLVALIVTAIVLLSVVSVAIAGTHTLQVVKSGSADNYITAMIKSKEDFKETFFGDMIAGRKHMSDDIEKLFGDMI